MRRVAALVLPGVVLMTVPPVHAQNAPPSPSADELIANSKQLTDAGRRCASAADGSIIVCGSDTDRHRLSPELRAVAGIGGSTRDSIPDAPDALHAPETGTVRGGLMGVTRLPYNWRSMGGTYGRPPEYNPLYELAKRATDPDNVAPIPATPEP